MKNLNIKTIRIDGGTQSRVGLNDAAVADYAQAIRDGEALPPVVVFFDGSDHWLADGFHRFHAYSTAGKASIPADVRVGNKRDAVLFSVGANTTHGLRRTNEDKRRAVQTLLDDAEWATWPEAEIARRCGVSRDLVRAVRESVSHAEKHVTPPAPSVPPEVREKFQHIEQAGGAPRLYRNKHGDVAVMDVSGQQARAKKAAPPSPVVEEHDDRDDRLSEAGEAIASLAEENEQLRTKLAIEQMDASEEAKSEAAQIIADLRAENATLKAELSAVRVMRDRYQAENAELMKQIAMNKRELQKARTAA